METPLADIAAAFQMLTEAGADRAPSAMSPAELAAVNDAFGALRRRVEAAYAPVAAEIARQSRSELGKDSFARKQGFRSPAALISATTGAPMGDAIRTMQVGEATAPRLSLTGDSLPAKHPHVASGLANGALGISAASAIIGMLDRIALRADPAHADAMERHLTHAAPGLTPEQLGKLIARAEAHLDPDGVEPRERELRGERSLIFREESSGMIVVSGRLDPETAAPVKAAVEGLVTGMIRRSKHADDDLADERSMKQMQADALADLCRHGLGCKAAPTKPSTTIVVRMKVDDLVEGTGYGTIDGIVQPVSAATVRRMAADAEIIPCVLGGRSEILDLGRGERIFSRAQRLALGERDGGCAFCGAPPGQAVAHHIRWWKRDAGATDLDNGILLCTTCHHRVHDDGWEIRIEGVGVDAVPWFIPPAWLDPARTPRRGGRSRYDIAA